MCHEVYFQNVLDDKITPKLKAFHNGILIKKNSIEHSKNYVPQTGASVHICK